MLLALQKGIIYGPVNSRRLGRSLGINLLPSDCKVCPFNCVYCQYGWTDIHTAKNKKLSLPPVGAVKNALKERLASLQTPPSFITFSGNGEPTLHPDFEEIVEEVVALCQRIAPKSKTAILSNSALINNSSLRKSLEKLDLRIMKLDCGSPQIFKEYNRPSKGIDLDKITEGLAKISNVVIQTLFSSGRVGNLKQDNIKAWLERLKKIKPISVQLYTLDRGYPLKELRPALKGDLKKIKELLIKEKIRAKIY